MPVLAMSPVLDLFEARNIITDPAPNWRWAVDLPVTVGYVIARWGIGQNGASYSSRGLISTPQVPYGMVESIDIPQTTIDMDARFGGATRLHYPRFFEAQQITINFYEDGGYNISKYLTSWKNEIILFGNNFQLPAQYKRPITVYGFDSRSNYEPRIIIELIDCWPMTSPGGLTYGNADSGFITVTCEFAVDKQDISFNVVKQRKDSVEEYYRLNKAVVKSTKKAASNYIEERTRRRYNRVMRQHLFA